MIESAVNIDVNVNGTQTVQQASIAFDDLGDAVAKTQRQAEELALQFGINDERTQEAIRTAGKYKQQLELLDQAVDAHRGGQETLFRAVQGVGAGFEVATGAMALFGSESEELNKVLMKVQGAMIFSQGLKDLKEFAPAIKNVGGMVTGALSNAFKSFGAVARTAIASTGIGVLVVSVGTLVAYWDTIIEKLNGVNKAQADLLNRQSESAKLAKEQLDDISAQENILKLQGKTEKEILNLKIQATKTAITGLEAQLLTQKEIKKQQIETAKQNKELLQGLIMFAYAPINLILKGIDLALNALGKKSNLLEGFTGGLAGLVFNPEDVANKADATIKETETQLNTLKNNLAGYQLSVRDINTKAQKENQAQTKAEFDGNLKLQQEYNQARGKQLESSSKDIINATRLTIESTNLIIENGTNRQMSSLKKLQLGVSAFGSDFVNTFSQAFSAISALETAYASSSESSQRKAFQTRKALAITQATISTIESAINAFKTASDSPISTAFPAYPFIQAGLATAFGLAKIKEIGKQQFQGSQAPSLGGSGVPSISAPKTIGASSLPQSSDFITADRRVYVLEGDIKRVSNRVSNTQAVSVVE